MTSIPKFQIHGFILEEVPVLVGFKTPRKPSNSGTQMVPKECKPHNSS